MEVILILNDLNLLRNWQTHIPTVVYYVQQFQVTHMLTCLGNAV